MNATATRPSAEPDATERRWTGLRPWLTAVHLLAALVAGLVMRQASDLLGSVQSEGRPVYTMDALVRVPLPFEDDEIVGAFAAWQGAAAAPTAEDTEAVDSALLELIQSWIVWHVWLDVLLFAPAVALILYWLHGRAYPGAGPWVRLALPASYLLLDWAETLWTYVLARGLLEPEAESVTSASGTEWLLRFTAAKWGLLLVNAVVISLGSLSRDDRFADVAKLGRWLWGLRVQVACVLIFAVLIALPLAGPLDQIPDLLRSAHDESWLSTEVGYPAVVLLGFCAVIWSSGMLIVRTVSGATGEPESSDGAVPKPRLLRFLATRLLWIALTVALGVAAVRLQRVEELRPSAGVWAAMTVVAALLVLDLVLAVLRRAGKATGVKGASPRLRSEDAAPLEWAVVVLASTPLAIAGLGAVRAYAALCLLQGGDSTRPVHPGATAWLWVGCICAVVGPLLSVWVLRGLGRRKKAKLRLALGLVMVLTCAAGALAVRAAIDPATLGEELQAHGLVTLWLALVVGVFGLLQWGSEAREPVPLADLLGMRRTPWIACVILVPLVASTMDTTVGYHAVSLQEGEAEQVALSDAFESWYDAARTCREDADVLPLVLVAAPGGGARAAYWTGQVMTRLQLADACTGGSVFAASGVSGGSVGLAVWSAKTDAGVTGTQSALEELVGPKALSATVAAMLFRDLPRSFVGIHPYEVDRAAVEQDVWIDQVPELEEPFFDGPSDDAWRPLLMLNASDIATGCKILVSQLEVRSAQADAEDGPSAQGCKQPPESRGGAPTALEAGSVDAARFLDPADCAETDRDGRNLSFAAAALLSARFPYVSPSGAMTACGNTVGDRPERLFAADGGYLENSGIHTLLALWDELEPLVARKTAGGGPRVRPLAVLVDNHYRSEASMRPGGRVRELTGPPKADQTALVGSEALEQALAAEFSPPVPGTAARGSSDAPDWFLIAPSTRPDVSAPLGWSLSKAARTALDCQLPSQLQVQEDDVAACPERSGTDQSRVAHLVALLEVDEQAVTVSRR